MRLYKKNLVVSSIFSIYRVVEANEMAELNIRD